jgi:hypothetical protein
MREISRAEKLLIAAGSIAAERGAIFSAEDLAVEAWKLFQADFSLKGHLDHTDINSVLTQIMGKKAPLIVRGWLEKVGAKQYRLTEKGLHDLRNLNHEKTAEIISRIRVSHQLEDQLGPLLVSDVFETWKEGRGEDITFHQFCRFAGLSARDRWQKVVGKLEQVSHLVDEAAKIGASGESLRIHLRNRNYEFSAEQLLRLPEIFGFMKRKFKREMEDWERHATG